MSEKFKGKYRSESARLPNWDYGSNAAYFITICTKDRKHYFGEIIDSKMFMNKNGKIANECWLAVPDHFPFVKLGYHVVMPNHFHGIIIIDKPVGTRLIASLPERTENAGDKLTGGITGNHNPMLNENLSKIIRWYKGRTTFEIRKIDPNFAWQSRFHDHIIRNDQSFHRISEYIKNNPSN